MDVLMKIRNALNQGLDQNLDNIELPELSKVHSENNVNVPRNPLMFSMNNHDDILHDDADDTDSDISDIDYDRF